MRALLLTDGLQRGGKDAQLLLRRALISDLFKSLMMFEGLCALMFELPVATLSGARWSRS